MPPIDLQSSFSVCVDNQFVRGTVYHVQRDTLKRFPAVILIHGFAGQRTEHAFLYVNLARQLAKCGICAITFDCRGSGESDGAFTDMLPTTELKDAMSVLEWAAGQPYIDRSRIGLAGFSLGGILASASLASSIQVKALSLLSPTIPEHTASYKFGKAGQQVVTFGPHLLHANFFEDVLTIDPFTPLKRMKPATLIIHGDNDERVPKAVSHTYQLELQSVGSDATTLDVPNADHLFNKAEPREQLINAVSSFFCKNL